MARLGWERRGMAGHGLAGHGKAWQFLQRIFMEWIQFLILLISVGGMFMWLKSDIALNRTEAAADRRDLLTIIREIQQENKDFHGRLERQDAEFKGILSRQDAEFKAHLIYEHGNQRK